MSFRNWIVSAVVVFGVTASSYGEFQINSFSDHDQEEPRVAMHSDGSFVAVWKSWYQDGSYTGIFGRRFNAAGQPLGDDFGVNADTDHGQGSPDIAMDGQGNSVVTFESGDGACEGIWARYFHANGTPGIPEVWVNGLISSRQLSPAIDMNPSGAIAIVWESASDSPISGAEWHVRGRGYDANGASGPEFQASQIAQSRDAAVSVDDTGDFVVAYTRNGALNAPPPGHSVRIRLYNANGTPKGTPIILASRGSMISDVAIDGDGAGNHVVAYTGGHIHAVWINAAGAIGQPETRICAGDGGCNQYHVGVAVNSLGQAVFVWTRTEESDSSSSRNVWGRAFGSDGLPLTEPFRLSTYAYKARSRPDVALNDAGRFVVVWQGDAQDGDRRGIFAATGRINDPGTPSWPGEIAGTVYHDNDPADGVRGPGVRAGGDPVIMYGFDCSSQTAAPFVGDLDLDGDEADIIFEAQDHCVKMINRHLVGRGMGSVVDAAFMLPFGNMGMSKSPDDDWGYGQYTLPVGGDADGDGTPEVEHMIDEIRLFGSSVSYAGMLRGALDRFEDIFDLTGADDGLLVILSAGTGLTGDPAGPRADALWNFGVDIVAMGMGATSVVDDPAVTDTDLLAVDPLAAQVTNEAELLARLTPIFDAWAAGCTQMESGLAGWTVFIDVNGNGTPDSGEPSDVTGPDGCYRLSVPAGFYVVRLLARPGWTTVEEFALVDVAAGMVASPVDFPMVLSMGQLAGDADADGDVDIDDFVILKKNFGRTDAVWADGDFDGDADVDIDDFVVLKKNFATTTAQ